jgi:two-component system, OmpR family, sensor kinase
MIARLGIGTRLMLVVVAALVVALAVTIVGFNLLLGRSLTRNADDLLRARATVELGLLHPAGSGVAVGERPDTTAPTTNAWIFSGSRLIEAPLGSPGLTAAARALAGRTRAFAEPQDTDARLYALPIVFDGRRAGTVVSGVSLAPYEQTRKTAFFASLVLGGVIVLLGALGARWLLASALRPVTRMTRQAAEWSERDLDHRFGLGAPNDELTELAATLDALLDRIAASIRHEQRFSAELSHELRTPLARVLAET